MTILILTILASFFSVLGKHIFKKWFNHITIYTITWYFLLSLYEVRLMHFIDISTLAWFVYAGSFLAFIMGSLTVYAARKYAGKDESRFVSVAESNILMADGGKVLHLTILILSVIGILAAVQHWIVLIDKFGSIAGVLINANLSYKMRVEGTLAGEVIPYVFITSYAAAFLSIVYITLKKKITIISVLPFIGVILKEVANSSRAGMMYILFAVIAGYFLINHFNSSRSVSLKRQRIKLAISAVLLISIMVSVAGLVRTSRQAMENYNAASKELNQFKKGFFITPSLYLYLCSHVGVFSEHLERNYDYRNRWGEVTFMPIYNLLSKFDLVKAPVVYEKGYYVPMWINTATYLRSVHEDFGPFALLWFPYLLGMFTSYFWYKYFEKRKTIHLVMLTYLFVMIMFSFLGMVTRMATWFLSLLLLLFIVPSLERLTLRQAEKKIKLSTE